MGRERAQKAVERGNIARDGFGHEVLDDTEGTLGFALRERRCLEAVLGQGVLHILDRVAGTATLDGDLEVASASAWAVELVGGCREGRDCQEDRQKSVENHDGAVGGGID